VWASRDTAHPRSGVVVAASRDTAHPRGGVLVAVGRVRGWGERKTGREPMAQDERGLRAGGGEPGERTKRDGTRGQPARERSEHRGRGAGNGRGRRAGRGGQEARRHYAAVSDSLPRFRSPPPKRCSLPVRLRGTAPEGDTEPLSTSSLTSALRCTGRTCPSSSEPGVRGLPHNTDAAAKAGISPRNDQCVPH
jgi:hypothetical protein